MVARAADWRPREIRALARPRRQGESAPDARGVGARRDPGAAVCGAVEAGDHSAPGFVWMERANQSARHDQRFELDLSDSVDAGADASKPGDSVTRRKDAGNRDQQRAVCDFPASTVRRGYDQKLWRVSGL